MKNAMRRTAVTVLCAAAFAGVAATSAQAATVWEVTGPDRTSFDAADADIPSVEAQCLRAGGDVVVSNVVTTYAQDRFYAWAKCRSR